MESSGRTVLTCALPSVPAGKTGAAAAALATTLGLAAASWIVAVRQMTGMDMGVATRLGSFSYFIAAWIAMMAAMMLPGAARAAVSRAQASGVRALPAFVASYLATPRILRDATDASLPADVEESLKAFLRARTSAFRRDRT